MAKSISEKVPSLAVHLRGEETAGQLAVIKYSVPAGDEGPPLHVHPSHGEGFYVLHGKLIFQVRDELLAAPAGTFAYASPGTPHTFANDTGEDARMLLFLTPAFDRFLEGRVTEQAHGGSPAREPSPAEAIAVGPRIGQKDTTVRKTVRSTP